MNTRKTLVILLAVQVALAVAGCSEENPGSSDANRTEQTAGVPEATLYTCGMHPHVIQEGPGQCPVCGMDLTPVRHSGESQGIVQVDPATIQSIGVRTTCATIERLGPEVRTTGIFEADETARIAVSTKISGWVERLFVNHEGARVSKGAPLFEIYSPELLATQEEYLLAARHASEMSGTPGEEDAVRLLDAARRRLAYWDLTERQIEALPAAGRGPRTQTVYASAGGTVVDLNVVEGKRIRAGETLMEITDLSRLWLMVDVFEKDLAWVDIGTKAMVELPYDPEEKLTSAVDFVYDTFDKKMRVGKTRITVANRDGKLKPGMFASVQLAGAPIEGAVVVPSDALIRSGTRQFVMQSLGAGRFRPVEVEIGLEAADRVQIREGLAGGEEIVTRAQFLIDSEAKLNAAVGAMSLGHDHGTMGAMSLGHDHGTMGAGAATAPESTPEAPDIYVLDADDDGLLYRCSSNPANLTDEREQIGICPGEVEEVTLGAAQTGLFNMGYTDFSVDVARADSNGDGSVYQCPMDWAVLHDAEGRCEVCGMFLESYSIEEASENLRNAGYMPSHDH